MCNCNLTDQLTTIVVTNSIGNEKTSIFNQRWKSTILKWEQLYGNSAGHNRFIFKWGHTLVPCFDKIRSYFVTRSWFYSWLRKRDVNNREKLKWAHSERILSNSQFNAWKIVLVSNIHTYIHIFIYIDIYIYIYTNTHTHTHTHLYMYHMIYLHTCTYRCLYTRICHICIYVYM